MKTPHYETVIDEMREQYMRRQSFHFDWEIDLIDSPIEKVFFAALLAECWEPIERCSTGEADGAHALMVRHGLVFDDPPPHFSKDRQRIALAAGCCATVCAAQMWLDIPKGRIRPDFVVLSGRFPDLPGDYETRVVVELDGHDFHERTPEQAQSDKSRDRELQALGWHVLRFTGREVLRDPFKCTREVLSLATAKRSLAAATARAGQS